MTDQETEVLARLREAIVALDAAKAAADGLVDTEEVPWPSRIKFMRRMVERSTAEFRHHATDEPAPGPAPTAAEG